LTDVVAISICDFELWPDAQQDRQKLPRVPMLSRWYMTEHSRLPETGSDTNKLLQVQYAFLELPKLPKIKPAPGALYWAWLFVHAPELTEVPSDLPPGPYRAALELANQATFTRTELDAYRKAMDEIQQARDYGADQRAEGKTEGKTEGIAEGKIEGKIEGIAEGKIEGGRSLLLRLLHARFGELPAATVARIETADMADLERWSERVLSAQTLAEVLAEPA
jgi:hypothetical protein